MSTNYYVKPRPCENPCIHCSAPESIHLGKSSSGWAFTFRGYPAIGDTERSEIGPVVTDYASWLTLLDLGEIEAEYGGVLTRDEMLEVITSTSGGRNVISGSPEFADDEGNRFLPGYFC